MPLKQENPEVQYAFKILGQFQEMISNEDCENYIGLKELTEGANLKAFFHAVTVASTMMYNKLTGDDKNNLEFNHVQNQLCFEYMVNVGQEKEGGNGN